MKQEPTLQLRLEMLRLRGAIERGEAAGAAAELRGRIQPFTRLMAGPSRAAGWIAALGGKPRSAWAMAWLAWRTARRHPRAALALAGAAIVWALLRRRTTARAAVAGQAGAGSHAARHGTAG